MIQFGLRTSLEFLFKFFFPFIGFEVPLEKDLFENGDSAGESICYVCDILLSLFLLTNLQLKRTLHDTELCFMSKCKNG